MNDTGYKAASIAQTGILALINPVIVIIVLRSLWGRIGGIKSESGIMFVKILALGVMFEIAMTVRVLLLLRQDDWKMNHTGLYITFFTIYIVVGEVACQVVLLLGILMFTRKLRVKYLRGNYQLVNMFIRS